MPAPGYAARMFGTLADARVNIEMISTSEVRITCMIAEPDLETALRALHDAFGRSEWNGSLHPVMKRLLEIRSRARGV